MSLKSNFIRHIKKTIVAGINRTNQILRVNTIVDGLNRIVNEQRFNRPILTPNNITRFERPPSEIMRKHNTNIEEVTGDMDVINDTIIELQVKESILNVLRNNTTKITTSMFNIIKDKIKELRRTYMINVQSIIENFEDSEKIETNVGGVIDTTQAIATLQQPISPVSSVTPDEGVVKVEVLSNITLTSPRNEQDILNITNDNNIQYNSVSSRREPITYKVSITFSNRPVNQVAININNKVPLRLRLNVNEKEKVSSAILLKGAYLFAFKEVKRANLVEFYLLAETEDFVRDSQYIYSLNLVNINIRNASSNLSAVITSKELEFNEPITEIAFKADEYVPARTDIKYYVADSNNPDNWIRVSPTHSMFEEQQWVSLGVRSEVNQIVEVDHRIAPTDAPGNSLLYNILDGLTEEGITDGVIDIPENWAIDTNKSTMHTGVNDYIIEHDYLTVKAKSRVSDYKFEKASTAYIDMVVLIEGETQLVESNQITLKYASADADILITDKTNIYEDFNVVGDIVYVQDIVEGTTVYVTYRAKMTEIETKDNKTIEIIQSSLQVRSAPSGDTTPFIEVVDILFDEKKIRILPNAGIPTDNTDQYYILYLTFDYNLKTQEKFKQFKTNLLFNSPTDIDILPFTDEEVAAGNLHIIDGNIVSRRTSYHMDRGWHTVITTQPFPSDVDTVNDVNSLTNAQSSAGIILKGFDKMYAYVNPMRYVSLHRLSNVISRHDHRTYTIHEGKLLVNFNPDVLLEASMDGDIVIGRNVVWIGKRVQRYELNYPKFEIHIVMKPTTADTANVVNKIKYRIEINRRPTASSPAVSALEVYGN